MSKSGYTAGIIIAGQPMQFPSSSGWCLGVWQVLCVGAGGMQTAGAGSFPMALGTQAFHRYQLRFPIFLFCILLISPFFNSNISSLSQHLLATNGASLWLELKHRAGLPWQHLTATVGHHLKPFAQDFSQGVSGGGVMHDPRQVPEEPCEHSRDHCPVPSTLSRHRMALQHEHCFSELRLNFDSEVHMLIRSRCGS